MYGSGKYTYTLAEDWAQLDGRSFLDVTGLAINNQDEVYIFNRGEHPIMVFDRNGQLLKSWGEGHFKRAHGCCIGSDSSIYCTDNGNHTVTKFTADGKVLLTLGVRDQPSNTGYRDKSPDRLERLASIKQGAPPFNQPTGVALSSTDEIYISI